MKIRVKEDKFAPRAKKEVLLGYSSTQKGYRLLDLETNYFFVSRDVIFWESIFPFKETQLQINLHTVMQNQDDFLCLQHDNIHVVEVHIIEEHGQAIEMPVMNTILEQSAEATPETSTNQPATNERDAEGLTEDFEQLEEIMDSTTPKNADHLAVLTLQGISKSEGISTTEIRQDYLHAFSVMEEPHSFKEAVKDKSWIEAMQQEVKALEDNRTWDVVTLPAGKSTI
nr:uncharacterized protein LOC104119673 [Nicotiana tomentosiformis]